MLKRVLALPVAVLAASAVATSASAVAAASARAAIARPAPRLPGTHCPAFPADSVWNTPITGLPVDRHSAQWLRSMDAGSTDLHPDFGPGDGSHRYGIPWQHGGQQSLAPGVEDDPRL